MTVLVPRWGAQEPVATDNNDVVRDIGAVWTALTNEGAIFISGTYASRPAAAYDGRFYFVNSGQYLGSLWYDSSTGWTCVGSIKVGATTNTASASTDVPLTVKGATGQTADLFQAYLPDGTTLGTRLSNNTDLGVMTSPLSQSGSSTTPAALSVTPRVGTNPAVVVRRSGSQSVNYFELQNSTGGVDMSVSASGAVSITTSLTVTGDVVGSAGSAYDNTILGLMGAL